MILGTKQTATVTWRLRPARPRLTIAHARAQSQGIKPSVWLLCIYHANEEKGAVEKLSYIGEALEKMLEVKLYVRILHDSKQFSLKKYALLCEQMVEIEKNLKNWKQYYSIKINQQ